MESWCMRTNTWIFAGSTRSCNKSRLWCTLDLVHDNNCSAIASTKALQISASLAALKIHPWLLPAGILHWVDQKKKNRLEMPKSIGHAESLLLSNHKWQQCNGQQNSFSFAITAMQNSFSATKTAMLDNLGFALFSENVRNSKTAIGNGYAIEALFPGKLRWVGWGIAHCVWAVSQNVLEHWLARRCIREMQAQVWLRSCWASASSRKSGPTILLSDLKCFILCPCASATHSCLHLDDEQISVCLMHTKCTHAIPWNRNVERCRWCWQGII